VKVIVDFSGYLQLRHPYELGGVAFSVTMVWSQIFPFVALQIFEGDGDVKDSIALFLVCSLVVWILLNAVFFKTINFEYVTTFFTTVIAPQYMCELFLTSESDAAKFRAVFKNRASFTKSIHAEVKGWVGENIEQWKAEKPTWFKIEKIYNELLPAAIFEAEGGRMRQQSSDSMQELIGLQRSGRDTYRVHPMEE